MKETRVDDIFARIGAMHLELDPDPIARGPKYLNNMVALCRNYTSEVQGYMREVQMFIRLVERDLRTARAEFDLLFNNLMATDPEIIQMRAYSRADREAVAHTKLQERTVAINRLDLALLDARHVEVVVESKLKELREISRDLRLQKQLVEAEIDTGSMWGNDHGPQDSRHLAAQGMDARVYFEIPADKDGNADGGPLAGGDEAVDYDDFFNAPSEAVTKSVPALDKAVEEVMLMARVEKPGATPSSIALADDEDVELDFDAFLKRMV